MIRNSERKERGRCMHICVAQDRFHETIIDLKTLRISVKQLLRAINYIACIRIYYLYYC